MLTSSYQKKYPYKMIGLKQILLSYWLFCFVPKRNFKERVNFSSAQMNMTPLLIVNPSFMDTNMIDEILWLTLKRQVYYTLLVMAIWILNGTFLPTVIHAVSIHSRRRPMSWLIFIYSFASPWPSVGVSTKRIGYKV